MSSFTVHGSHSVQNDVSRRDEMMSVPLKKGHLDRCQDDLLASGIFSSLGKPAEEGQICLFFSSTAFIILFSV